MEITSVGEEKKEGPTAVKPLMGGKSDLFCLIY